MKATKKNIQRVLRNQNITEIFKIAKIKGVDVKNTIEVYNFIREYAPSKKVYREAYRLSCLASHKKYLTRNLGHPFRKEQISDAVKFAKQQVKEGYSSYSKILIEGNTNIYWASPLYKHRDYNKAVAFPNTDKNKQAMEKINKFLNKNLVEQK